MPVLCTDEVYTLTHVTHRQKNDVIYLHSTRASIIPADLLASLLCWLDDILLHRA